MSTADLVCDGHTDLGVSYERDVAVLKEALVRQAVPHQKFGVSLYSSNQSIARHGQVDIPAFIE
jgi:hypothetical protein